MNLATIECEIAALAGYEYQSNDERIGAVSTLATLALTLRRTEWDEGQAEWVQSLAGMADALRCELAALAGIGPIMHLPLFGDWSDGGGNEPESVN